MNRLGYFLTLLFLVLFTSHGLVAEEPEKDEKEQDKEKKEDKKKKSNKVYAIKDKYGNIIGYTDTPKKDSEEIIIQKSTEYSPPETVTAWSSNPAPEEDKKDATYSNFSIASPANDATIRNNAGSLQVAVDIRPRLLPGHSVQLLVDGKVMAKGKSPILSVSNVDRGSHQLTAQIQSANGQVVKTTAPITVHLHRATIRKGN